MNYKVKDGKLYSVSKDGREKRLKKRSFKKKALSFKKRCGNCIHFIECVHKIHNGLLFFSKGGMTYERIDQFAGEHACEKWQEIADDVIATKRLMEEIQRSSKASS